MKPSSREKSARAPRPRSSLDPSLSFPDRAKHQGTSIDPDGGNRAHVDTRKSPATERYLHEKDDLALGVARKPANRMPGFMNHWQEEWNSISLSRRDRRLQSLRRRHRSISPTHVSKPLKSRPSSWRLKGHIPRKRSNQDFIDADAVQTPKVDNPRQSGGYVTSKVYPVADLPVPVSIGADPSEQLLIAARDDYDFIIESLLETGADIEHTTNDDYYTPLLIAAFRNHDDVVRVLLSNAHKKANIHAKDKWGCNVLHVALLGPWVTRTIVSFLLMNGADPNAQDNDGETPLHYCAKYGKSDDAQVLLDAGAATEINDSAGETPLSSAFRLNRLYLVQMLLEAGAVVVDSSLGRSSPIIKYTVAEHRGRLDWNSSRGNSGTRTDTDSIEEGYRKSSQEKSQSMQIPDGIEPTFVKYDKVVSGVVRTQDQKPGTSKRREYDQEDEPQSPEAPSSTGPVDGQESITQAQKPGTPIAREYDQEDKTGSPKPPSSTEPVYGQEPVDMIQVIRSSQEDAKDVPVEVAKKIPTSASQQNHALLTDSPAAGDTRGFESCVSSYVTSSPDDELVQVLDSNSYLSKDNQSRFSESIVPNQPANDSSTDQVSKSAALNEKTATALPSDFTYKQQLNEQLHETVVLASEKSDAQLADLDHHLDEIKQTGMGDRKKESVISKARKRTKTSCLNCRRMKIKCDGEQPTCGTCVRLKLVCEKYTHRLTSKDLLKGYRTTLGMELQKFTTTQTLDAEAIADSIASEDLKSVTRPDPKDIEDTVNADLLHSFGSEPSDTPELKGDLQKSSYETTTNGQHDISNKRTLVSETLYSSDLAVAIMPWSHVDAAAAVHPSEVALVLGDPKASSDNLLPPQPSLQKAPGESEKPVLVSRPGNTQACYGSCEGNSSGESGDISILKSSEVFSANSKTHNNGALRQTVATIPCDGVISGNANPRQSVHSVTNLLKVLAEALGLREKPLEPGLQRVRWTCVCGAPLYDDFREIETGSLAQLQHALSERTPGPSTNGVITSQAGQQDIRTRGAASSQPLVDHGSPPNTDVSSNGNSPEGLRSRRQRQTPSQDEGLNLNETWILPIFQYERYGTKVKHLPVHGNMTDESLFTTIKNNYFAQTSRVRRFIVMRGVKKISCVKFIYAPREPDIHKFDDWPTQKHSPPWIYKGCPAKKKHIPLVGHTYLMHLWQNPTHTDEQTYRAHNSGLIQRSLKYLRLYFNTSPQALIPAKQTTQTLHTGDIELACTNSSNNTSTVQETHLSPALSEVPQPSKKRDFRSSYVFLRTPKKLGEQLLPDDENPPEAWGLYFEEGFRIHHAFIVILFLYCLASLAFGIYWCVEYGLVGPKSGAEAFAVSAWMIGFVSLVTTVWFKWAD